MRAWLDARLSENGGELGQFVWHEVLRVMGDERGLLVGNKREPVAVILTAEAFEGPLRDLAEKLRTLGDDPPPRPGRNMLLGLAVDTPDLLRLAYAGEGKVAAMLKVAIDGLKGDGVVLIALFREQVYPTTITRSGRFSKN